MLTEFDASIVIDTAQVREQWCTFEHHVALVEGEPPTLILIGACRVHEVYEMREGRQNTEWARLFKNGGSILVRIRVVTNDRHEAFRYAQQLLQRANPKPICNVKGHSTIGQQRPVICLTNDVRYRSQKDAALALGIHQSSISRHLRGDLLHANGHKFIYAEPEPLV